MGIGKINVYITALGQPCKIDNAPWVVAVAHCDGSVLNWSEGRFKNEPTGAWNQILPHVPPATTGSPSMPLGWYYDSVPASNGHVEIEVPPGRYVVTASKHTWTGIIYDLGFWKWVLWGNWATEHAIINVGCNEDVCATLYSPTFQGCWNRLFPVVLMALESREIQNLVKAEDMKAVREAAMVLEEKLFKPIVANGMTPFEQQDLAQLKRALKAMEKKTEETKK